ncbi:MAG: FkbM family methyltransferase [Spirochaetes bacterium]|nr:FkbM family methyltransferase [Spirochaetota bacterium]
MSLRSLVKKTLNVFLSAAGAELIKARTRLQTRKLGRITIQNAGFDGTYTTATGVTWQSIFPNRNPKDGKAVFFRSQFNLDWLDDFQILPTVIFDIGSYDAGDSIRFKSRFPKAKVVAFEADPRLHGNLAQYVSHFGVESFHGAVCDHDGTASFFLATEIKEDGERAGGQGSLHKHTDDYRKTYDHIRQAPAPTVVPATRVDTYCRQNNIDHIDVTHIDAEGAELEVVKGFGDMRPTLVFVETVLGTGWENTSRKELYQTLEGMGYRLALDLPSDRLYYYDPAPKAP